MHKQILTEKFVLKDRIPSELNVDFPKLKEYILSHYNDKFLFQTSNRFTKYPTYYKLNYNQQLGWLSTYICDMFRVEYNTNLVPVNEDAMLINFLEKEETTSIANHIDRWRLEQSPDISVYVCFTETKEQTFNYINFEYDDNRIVDKVWSTPIQYKNMIVFNSSLNHRITPNKNDDLMINVLFRYQII